MTKENKKRPAGSRRNPQVRNGYGVLDSGRVVEGNPSGTGLQASPASSGTLTGFYFRNGEDALAGVLSDSGIVCASTLTDVQIGDGHADKEWNVSRLVLSRSSIILSELPAFDDIAHE